jgi:cellulose synthase/poly-beta-1,6-N-acetylglucosamine synthase-like glycosyltransferase
MSPLMIVVLSVSSLYFILVTIFVIGWRRMSIFSPYGVENSNVDVSVVVAFRNEKTDLQRLLSCLAQQSFQNFELILVDDHSDDGTRKTIDKIKDSFPRIQIIDAVGHGKKNDLKEGIMQDAGSFIVTTDADCVPSFHWLETIVSFQNRYDCELIICPVRMIYNDNFESILELFEFTSLITAGGGATGLGLPILCNGANLAFKKESWLLSLSDLHEEEQSGDDIFLLQSIKKRKGRIRFLKSQSAFVSVDPSQTFSGFFRQRRRWASKSRAYTDWQLIVTACIVFAMSVMTLGLFTHWLIDPNHWKLLVAVVVFKYFIDTVFLYSAKKFFQLRFVWLFSFFLSIFYPFYIVIVGCSALIFKPRNW